MRFNHLYLDHWSGLAAHDKEAKKDFLFMASTQLKKAAKGLGLTKKEFVVEKSDRASGSVKLTTAFGTVLVMGYARSDKATVIFTSNPDRWPPAPGPPPDPE